MPAHRPSVPVRLQDTWGGLAASHGIVRLEGEWLVLEFETKDEILSVLTSGPKQCRLELGQIESCRWQPGWWGGRLELATSSLAVLAGIPGAAQGRISLVVARRDRAAALGLAADVELALAERVVRSSAGSGWRGHAPEDR